MMRELIVDLFAGGGGASTAIHMATGRHPDVAVNHNPDAIGVHEANHPQTRHYLCDVHEVAPLEACTIDGVLHPVGLLWASPDCTHFSKARGGKPVEKRIRSLADIVVVWARWVRPRLIHLENVEEFQDWGPVLENGKPCPERKGIDFRRWVRELEALGYAVEWRELVAADYGAPTTRKRLFLIARCDGQPIVWPRPTHASRAALAKGDPKALGLKPWRAAAEILDWSLEAPSIFTRPRPLKPKTRARIAKGVRRFVIEAPRPFIVPITHTGPGRVHDAADPLRTVTGANRGEFSVVAPAVIRTDFVNTRAGCVYPAEDPIRTATAQPAMGLMAAYLEQANTRDIGSAADGPARTVTSHSHQGLAAAALVRQFGTATGRDVREPNPTVMADGSGGKTGVVVAAIDKYYGAGVAADVAEPLDTATAKARFGLAAAFLEQANTGMVGHRPEQPVSTITARGTQQRLIQLGMVPANDHDGASTRRCVIDFLWEHFGAPTAAEWADPLATPAGRLKFGLVILDGQVWQIADIGMRMLTPRELFNAQGFPPGYIIDRTADGRPVTKTAQTALAGNSVSPPPAEATLRANLTWMDLPERRAA